MSCNLQIESMLAMNRLLQVKMLFVTPVQVESVESGKTK